MVSKLSSPRSLSRIQYNHLQVSKNRTESRVKAEFALVDLIEAAKNVEDAIGNFLSKIYSCEIYGSLAWMEVAMGETNRTETFGI